MEIVQKSLGISADIIHTAPRQMASDSDSDELFKPASTKKKNKATSILDLDGLVGLIKKQKEIHGKSHEVW